jgi:CBS domain-containing protein
MISVKEVLQVKGFEVWTIDSDQTVYAALQQLAEKNIGALVVLRDGRAVGILSERDYARKVILEGKTSRDTLVHQIMSTSVVGVSLESSMEECMAIMTERHIRHLPVFVGEDLIGVISIGDVVKAIISNQEILIDHLVSYITGR